MNQNLTVNAYVLDRSGSMESLQEAAISGFNHFVKEQLKAPGEENLSPLKSLKLSIPLVQPL